MVSEFTIARLVTFGAIALILAALALLPNTSLSVDTHDFIGGMAAGMAVALAGWLVLRLIKPPREQHAGACDSATPALGRRYLREFFPAIFGYVLAMLLSVWLLQRSEPVWLRALIALLPIPPIALAMRAVIRRIRDSDELQRKIELEAVSFASALVSLVYLAGGFLQLAKVVDVPSDVAMVWVFPLMCMSYGLAKLVIMRRYA